MMTSTPTSSRSRGNEVLGFAHGIWRAARLPMTFGLVIGVICGIPPIALPTEEVEASAAQPMPDERFAIHGQTTYVEQETDLFTAPYSGPNSLSPDSGRETIDATLFVGARLWSGAEGWITPEIDQGFGLDNTLGVAGFPSGEAYKVGKKEPYLRLPRAFVRQTIINGSRTPVTTPTVAPYQLSPYVCMRSCNLRLFWVIGLRGGRLAAIAG